MAFWDFIKQLRLNDEEEKKRREQGGVTNRIFGFLDDTLDTTGDVGKWGIERSKDVVGTVAGLGREAIVKPVVTAIASAEEKQQDYKKDSQVEVINKLKDMKPDEREEYIKSNPVLSNRYKDGKLKFTDTTAPWLFGNIFKGADTMAEVDVKDNEQLNQLIAKINERDTANDKGRQSTNFVDRQIFGNEPIQAYQNRYAGLKDEAGWSTPAAVLGTGANVLLDSPLSGGTSNVIKNIGKEGLEKLAKTSAVEGVESILKGNLKDEVIKKVAPLIAEATDVNQIKKLLGDVDPSIAKRIVTGKTKTEAVDEAVGSFRRGIDDVAPPTGKTDPLDTATDAAAQTQKAIDERKLAEGQSAMDSMDTVTPPAQPPIPPAQTRQTGSAGDELLSRMYSTSDIDAKMKKKTWRQELNERWFDKTAAYNRFSSLYKEKTGEDLAKDLDPAVLAQRTNGRERAASMRLEPVIQRIRQSGDFDAVRKLGAARHMLSRPDTTPAETLVLARRTIDELQASLGDEGMRKVDDAVRSVNEFYDNQLKDLVSIGRLSEDSYNYIRQSNPDYFSKISLIEHIIESNDTSRFAARASHNQAKENIIQAVKGIGDDSRFHIQDPIEMMARSAIAVQKAVEDTQLFKAIQNFEQIDPNSFKTIRASENVIKRMGLSLENKELRPIRDKAERMIKTREKWAKQLQSQINKLEKQGLHKALKGDGTKPMPEFSVRGLGGNAPTSKAADQLGPQDTARFVKSLVEGPNSEIKRLKKMVGTRDAHLAKTLDEIDSLNQEYFEAAQKIASNSKEAQALMDLEVPKGLKVISAIQNGVVERVAVPEEVYEAFTGLNAAQKDVVSGTMRKINKVAKEAFTTYNPAFALITNPIRDIGNSAFTSKEVPVRDYVLVLPYAKRWVQSFWGSLINDEAAQRLARAGAGNAGQFTYDLNPEKFSKELRRKTNGVEVKNPKDFMREVARLAGMPGRGIKTLGTAVENATRGVEGRAALKRGASDIEAAVAARRVSTDFAQGGKDAQAINNYLNFFNARLQGTRNIVKGIKDNPKRAGVLITAGVMMPAAATYLYNETNHPEVMDQIDQQTKDNNWIFVVGDGVDEDGRPNQFITVPKNDAQKIFSVPIENALKALKNDYPDSFAQIATKMLGSVSPVDFQKDGQLNASRMLGGILPAPISAGVQAVTNKNLYFDSKIVPDSLSKLPAEEQYTDKTPGIDKFIAAALPGEQSPMKVTAVRRGLTGRSADNPIETMKGPLTASGGAVQSEFYKLKSKADKNRASASKYINESIAAGDLQAATETANAYNQYLIELYTPFGERYGDYMTEELDSIYQDLKINLNKRSIAARRRTLEKVAQ